jgi:hypothetical protein
MSNRSETVSEAEIKSLVYGVRTFQLFIDFKAAIDTIKMYKLPEAVKEFKISQKLIREVGATLKHVTSRV